MIKSASVQRPKGASWRLAHDSRGSRRIVEQCQLSKGLTLGILLEESLLGICRLHVLGTGKNTVFHHVKVVAIITLLNNVVARFGIHEIHRIQDRLLIFGVQGVEHEVLFHSLSQGSLLCECLLVYWWRVRLVVKLAEHLSGH
jgi:hypothetical protein